MAHSLGLPQTPTMPGPRNPRAPTPHRLGQLGEALAAAHLERNGWTVVGRNVRLGHREIDLIVRRADIVAFVEVKTRTGHEFGHPLESITRRKRSEIERVARAWITRHGLPDDSYRFDAIAILWHPDKPSIDHVEDAWRMM